MDHFWHFAKRMLRYRAALALALVFAALSAGGMGAGLMSLGPMADMILNSDGEAPDLDGEPGRSLREIALEYNEAAPMIAVPEWMVDRLPSDPFHGVILIVIVLFFLTILGATANFLHQYFSMMIITRTIAGVRRDCFRRVIQMPLGRIVTRGPSDFVARIIRDTAELQSGLIALTSKALAQMTKGLAAFLVAIWFSWQLTLLALITAPLLAVALRKIGKRIRRGTRGTLEAQQELLRIASESLRGVRAVKANTGERETAARFHQKNKDAVRQEMRVRMARALSGPVVETLAIIAIGALLIIAAQRILSGNLEFSIFFLTTGSLVVALASFKPLTGLINEMQAASAPAERLLEILNEPREVRRDERKPALPRHAETITFRDVTFTYEGAAEPALRGINLTINHGERVAIVGPNGSGKTTLLSLVPRLLSPTAGTVLIDDFDLEAVNLRSLRRQIGVVTQETVLFRGTVAENIAFGTPGRTREEVIEAATQARADGFIRELMRGYDHELVEGGASLSGGQRQRVAIARAILRQPSILILDEATSQIDSDSEALITAALEEFCEGRTSLIIAHRLSTVLHADRIVVMDEGRMVDIGTHEDLLQRCELYQRLAQHQLIGSSGSGVAAGRVAGAST